MAGRLERVIPPVKEVVVEMKGEEILKVHHGEKEVGQISLVGVGLRIAAFGYSRVAHVDIDINPNHNGRMSVGLATHAKGLADKQEVSTANSTVRHFWNQVKPRTEVFVKREVICKEGLQDLKIRPLGCTFIDDNVDTAPNHCHNAGYGTPE